jgi:hypothetical protein
MMVHFRRHRGDFGAVLMAFLFGGIILNLYLNHPCYEPRDRDYAYILSFYAFALWIGVGAAALVSRFPRRWAWALLAAAPLLMAAGNWNDHDRSHCHSVHDISLNHLQSCDHGAILFSHGDNDTFPLWYLRHVERRRTDMDIYNINLTDPDLTRSLLRNSDGPRPLYFTHYAYERYKDYFPGRFRCEGFCWRLLPDTVEPPAPGHCGATSPTPSDGISPTESTWTASPGTSSEYGKPTPGSYETTSFFRRADASLCHRHSTTQTAPGETVGHGTAGL